MADKMKKISINALEEATISHYAPEELVDWRGLHIVIKRNLTLKEMLSFADFVTKSCFTEEGAYMPEIKDFAIRSSIVEYYTNITLPSGVDKRYDLLYQSDLVDIVAAAVDKAQLNMLLSAIAEKTAHLAQANIEAVAKQMNELYAAFENMQSQFANSFGNIDSKTISNVLSAFSGGIDEGKIVEAILARQSAASEK